MIENINENQIADSQNNLNNILQMKQKEDLIIPESNPQTRRSSHQGTNLDLIDQDPFDLTYDDIIYFLLKDYKNFLEKLII